MRFLPATVTREESDAVAARAAGLAERGFGLWAVEVERSGDFAGFVGLAEARFEAHFTPATEIGWRLGRRHWGPGTRPRRPRRSASPSSGSGSGSGSERSSRSRPSRACARAG
jgi:hypothetical protein